MGEGSFLPNWRIREEGTSEFEPLKLKFPLRLLDQVASLQMKNI